MVELEGGKPVRPESRDHNLTGENEYFSPIESLQKNHSLKTLGKDNVYHLSYGAAFTKSISRTSNKFVHCGERCFNFKVIIIVEKYCSKIFNLKYSE